MPQSMRMRMRLLRVEHRVVVVDGEVLARRRRDVRFSREAGLVEALGGLDDLVHARGDLGGRDASAEDVPRGDGGAVELAVGVLALDEHRALEREPGEESWVAVAGDVSPCEPQPACPTLDPDSDLRSPCFRSL